MGGRWTSRRWRGGWWSLLGKDRKSQEEVAVGKKKLTCQPTNTDQTNHVITFHPAMEYFAGEHHNTIDDREMR